MGQETLRQFHRRAMRKGVKGVFIAVVVIAMVAVVAITLCGCVGNHTTIDLNRQIGDVDLLKRDVSLFDKGGVQK